MKDDCSFKDVFKGGKLMKKPKIFITREIPKTYLQAYESYFTIDMWPETSEPIPRDLFLKKVKDVDGLLTMLSERIDQEVLTQAKQLKIISNLAVGYDNIDVATMQKHGITVTNTPDVLTETTADLT